MTIYTALTQKENLCKHAVLQHYGYASPPEQQEIDYWRNNKDVRRRTEEGTFWIATAPVLVERARKQTYGV